MKRILIAFTALAAFFTACDTGPIENALDNFALVIGLEPINTNASVLVYDAVTNELVAGDITVTIGGDNGDQVIDVFSDPIEETKFEGGTFNFGLANAFTPDTTNPASIAITLNASGYLETTISVEITNEGLSSFEVEMMPLNALPDNISQSTQSSPTDGSGNPTPPSDMNPPQNKTGFSQQPQTSSIFNPTFFARNGGNTIATENFSGRYSIIDQSGNVTNEAGYFSSIQVTQISLGTSGDGLSSIPNPQSGVRLIPGVQIVQSAKSLAGKDISAFMSDDGESLGEIWTYLGRHSQLQTSVTYQQFIAGNGWITQSSRADYRYSVVLDPTSPSIRIEKTEMVASKTRVIDITSPTNDFTNIQEFLDVITAENNTPKLVRVTVAGQSDPYIWLAQNGQIFKYLTFALEVPQVYVRFGLDKNGNSGSIPTVGQILGRQLKWDLRNLTASGGTIGYVYPKIDLNTTITITLPWTNIVYNVNPAPYNDNDIAFNIVLPTRPSNLVGGTVTVDLICTNGAPGVRLTDLPATPIQFRKRGGGTRWQQATVTWNYDSVEKVLKGGSFSASMENNVEYEFQISVDGSLYPSSGPEVKTITFDNQNVATFEYRIDNKDFCAQ